MSSSPSTTNGDVPSTDPAMLPWPKRSLKQVREALRVMAGTPRVLKLVWKSHPKFTSVLIAANLLHLCDPHAQSPSSEMRNF